MSYISIGNMDSRDILKFVNFIYCEYKAKCKLFPEIYVLCCFDEILTSRKPNTVTFSITST